MYSKKRSPKNERAKWVKQDSRLRRNEAKSRGLDPVEISNLLKLAVEMTWGLSPDLSSLAVDLLHPGHETPREPRRVSVMNKGGALSSISASGTTVDQSRSCGTIEPSHDAFLF